MLENRQYKSMLILSAIALGLLVVALFASIWSGFPWYVVTATFIGLLVSVNLTARYAAFYNTTKTAHKESHTKI